MRALTARRRRRADAKSVRDRSAAGNDLAPKGVSYRSLPHEGNAAYLRRVPLRARGGPGCGVAG